MKKFLVLGSFAIAMLFPSTASACWDNTDLLVKKIKKLELTTDQLKDVFQYQKAHKDLITQCHQDGRGCGVHERAEKEFEKKAYGVLTDEQFEKATSRKRSEVETLRYENYRLAKQNKKLQRELDRLKKATADEADKAAPGQKKD